MQRLFIGVVIALFGPLVIGRSAPSAAGDGAACAHPTHFDAGGAANVVHVRTAKGQVWGLALGPGSRTATVGHDLKIVWRITGSGPLRVSFVDPGGRRRALLFGPEPHTGASTFHHPGDEWGTGFHFDAPGCWQIRLARSPVRATVRLTVAAPPAAQSGA